MEASNFAIVVAASLFGVVLGGLVSWFLAKKKAQEEVQERVRLKEAELSETQKALVREAEEAKNQARAADAKLRNIERELKNVRAEIQKREEKVARREELVDKKAESLAERESELSRREKRIADAEKALSDKAREAEAMLQEAQRNLQRLAGMTEEQAKKMLYDRLIEQVKMECAKEIKQLEEKAKEEAEDRAKRIISIAIGRYAGEVASDRATSSVVVLPSEEMKGRIIGREGRNIKLFESITGVDVIVDDSPDTVTVSCFNPVRREVGRLALEWLVADGRIHPARIEELVKKARDEVNQQIKKAGEEALFKLGIGQMHPELVKLIGTMRFRSSYGQNVWAHSIEVGFLAGLLAAELDLPIKEARRAGLLHDIGKAIDHEVEGPHALIGANFARKYGESAEIVHAIAAHHEEEKPMTLLAHLVIAADAISGARPGARRESLENYVKRLQDLETIATSFPGVERAFAIQAGREVRVIVKDKEVNDEQARLLAREIAQKIQEKATYPGQITVCVIRETRAIETAR
jgi:ribonuclease Y